MRKFLSTLIPIAAFAGLVLIVLVPMLVAENWLGLKKPWPVIIGFGCVVATLAVLYFWMVRAQQKETAIAKRSKHRVFGDVRHFADHWESSVSGIHEVNEIEIWGESTSPTDQQVSTMSSVRERFPELADLAVAAVNDAFKTEKLSLSRETIKLESIYLAAKPMGSFDLIFAAPAHKKHLPWGFSATFIDFEVDEISDNH